MNNTKLPETHGLKNYAGRVNRNWGLIANEIEQNVNRLSHIQEILGHQIIFIRKQNFSKEAIKNGAFCYNVIGQLNELIREIEDLESRLKNGIDHKEVLASLTKYIKIVQGWMKEYPKIKNNLPRVLLDSFDATIVGGFRETVLPRFRQLRADLIALEDIM